MSYSISVKLKNENQAQLMYDFLIQNNYLLNNTYFASLDGNIPQLGEYLSYSPKLKHLLGFNGSLIDGNLWAVCAWIAFKNNIKSSDGRYVFYYDSEKHYAVVGNSTLDTLDLIIDTNGIIVVRSPKPGDSIAYINYLNLFKEEREHTRYMMLILNEEWENYIKNLDLNQSQKNNKSKVKNKITPKKIK